MLQWMGGSRRKVTTSRKSAHKRQKQYFEQRKRQQQQQTAGLESYADGRRLCSENNRSLDILSLINVSTTAQECKTSCINARDNSEDDDITLNHQYAQPSLAIPNNEDIPVDQTETKEERTPSNYGTGAEYSNKVSVHLPSHNEDIVGNGNKLDPFKLSTTLPEISVIDLLGDGGPNTNAEENSVHPQEAHVAFSIEGLGKVEAETPLHSPKIHGRSIPKGFSSPKKARRQPITSKHTDYGFHDLGPQMDVMMQDADFSPFYSSTEQTFCSKDMMNIIDDPNLKFLSFRNSSPFNWDGSNFPGAFDNDEVICNIRGSSRNIWKDPSFLDDSTDDLGEHETFCENWAEKRSVAYDDYFLNKDLWKQDFNFEGWNLQKKRPSTKRTENFDIRETPVPCTKHQIKEDLSDIISNTRWYSAVGIDNDVKDAVNCFVREDNRESLSRLSEESCSSTAVRGDATKKS